MKSIDLPLEIRTMEKEKRECIDIKEIEHERGRGDTERGGKKCG